MLCISNLQGRWVSVKAIPVSPAKFQHVSPTYQNWHMDSVQTRGFPGSTPGVGTKYLIDAGLIPAGLAFTHQRFVEDPDDLGAASV